jgi:hypothetical protein
MKRNCTVLYLVQEHDFIDHEKTTIGIASTLAKAQDLIDEYYREYKLLNRNDVNEGGMCYSLTLEVKDYNGEIYKAVAWVEDYYLDEII